MQKYKSVHLQGRRVQDLTLEISFPLFFFYFILILILSECRRVWGFIVLTPVSIFLSQQKAKETSETEAAEQPAQAADARLRRGHGHVEPLRCHTNPSMTASDVAAWMDSPIPIRFSLTKTFMTSSSLNEMPFIFKLRVSYSFTPALSWKPWLAGGFGRSDGLFVAKSHRREEEEEEEEEGEENLHQKVWIPFPSLNPQLGFDSNLSFPVFLFLLDSEACVCGINWSAAFTLALFQALHCTILVQHDMHTWLLPFIAIKHCLFHKHNEWEPTRETHQ